MTEKPAFEPARHFQGRIHDGVSAHAAACTVICRPDRLLAIDPVNGKELSWPLREIQLADEHWHKEHTVRLRTQEADGPRVEVDDAAILDLLKAGGAPLKRGYRTFFPASLATGMLAAVLAILWFGMPLLANGLAKVAPREWEEQLGERVADITVKAFAMEEDEVRACVGEKGTAALAGLVNKLDAHDGRDYVYRIRVIESDTVNAFAAPGGYIVILSAILDEFETPEELAAVLAHEMAHVTHQHSLKGIVRASGVAAIASVITGDVTGSTFGIAIEMVISSANTRAMEKEADVSGITYLNRAGITSTGLGTFFERISEEHGEGGPLLAFISSHPASETRAGYAKTIAQTANAPMSDEEWKAVQNICGTTEVIDRFEWPEWMDKIRQKFPGNGEDAAGASENT